MMAMKAEIWISICERGHGKLFETLIDAFSMTTNNISGGESMRHTLVHLFIFYINPQTSQFKLLLFGLPALSAVWKWSRKSCLWMKR
jgi:hypothetical protein